MRSRCRRRRPVFQCRRPRRSENGVATRQAAGGAALAALVRARPAPAHTRNSDRARRARPCLRKDGNVLLPWAYYSIDMAANQSAGRSCPRICVIGARPGFSGERSVASGQSLATGHCGSGARRGLGGEGAAGAHARSNRYERSYERSTSVYKCLRAFTRDWRMYGLFDAPTRRLRLGRWTRQNRASRSGSSDSSGQWREVRGCSGRRPVKPAAAAVPGREDYWASVVADA